MIRWFGLVILLFTVLLVSGCVQSGTVGLIECGSDGDCFSQALQNCDSAYAELTSPGFRSWELVGKEGGFCKIQYISGTYGDIEHECYIKIGTILEGENKVNKLADIRHKANCTRIW